LSSDQSTAETSECGTGEAGPGTGDEATADATSPEGGDAGIDDATTDGGQSSADAGLGGDAESGADSADTGLGGDAEGGSGSTGTDGGPLVHTIVSVEDFETGPATGTWVTDNSAAQAGTLSSHPPILGPNSTASMSFSCGGKSHSQLTFWYRGAPAAGQTLGFFVDGTLYQT
jgi:hypothetical protein